jgi:predicted SprT family Zn-dependent metalloprotease
MSAEDVAAAVLAHYAKLKKTGKPQGREFTVLAGLVLEVRCCSTHAMITESSMADILCLRCRTVQQLEQQVRQAVVV